MDALTPKSKALQLLEAEDARLLKAKSKSRAPKPHRALAKVDPPILREQTTTELTHIELVPATNKPLRFRKTKTVFSLLPVAPAIAINCWPRLSQYIAGTADQGSIGIILFQAFAILLMARIPFRMTKANWSGLLFVGLFFGLINVVVGTEIVATQRDTASDSRHGSQEHSDVTSLAIEMARNAVAEATSAKNQECVKVGPFCRQRISELAQRQAELTAALNAKANSAPPPRYADPLAARFAHLLHIDEQTVFEYWPIVFSFGAELMALVGPFILLGGYRNRAMTA